MDTSLLLSKRKTEARIGSGFVFVSVGTDASTLRGHLLLAMPSHVSVGNTVKGGGSVTRNHLQYLYQTWSDMKQRCYNPNNKAFKYYGERGIAVCDEWKNSFKQFMADMGERPSKEYSLDRVDNDKGYSKDNCRWATKKEQMNNKRQRVSLR